MVLPYAGYPYSYNGYPNAGLAYGYAGQHYGYAAPVAAAPIAYAAPMPVPSSQFHAQDEFGNLNYGYTNLNSHKQEVGNTYGGVSGGYSYVDANGVLQQVRYIADGAGFRVADSRLPVAPVFDGVAPIAPLDTAEVIEARAAFATAYAAQEAAVSAA